MHQHVPGGATDVGVPHSARVWNYWLGGKDHYPIDQIVGDQMRETFPGVVAIAQGTRALLGRMVEHLAGEAGIDQFLDIGTGLPMAGGTHEVAQRVNPAARVVHVDNDPLVLRFAEALLIGSPQGRIEYVRADLHEPAEILSGAGEALDLSRPVALALFGVMGHARSVEAARHTLRALLDALPSGSYLALSDGTATSQESIRAHDAYNRSGAAPYHLRDVADIESYFEGLDLVEPGVARIDLWRRSPYRIGTPPRVEGYCGLGRKP